jgi:hypothetical protein
MGRHRSESQWRPAHRWTSRPSGNDMPGSSALRAAAAARCLRAPCRRGRSVTLAHDSNGRRHVRMDDTQRALTSFGYSRGSPGVRHAAVTDIDRDKRPGETPLARRLSAPRTQHEQRPSAASCGASSAHAGAMQAIKVQHPAHRGSARPDRSSGDRGWVHVGIQVGSAACCSTLHHGAKARLGWARQITVSRPDEWRWSSRPRARIARAGHCRRRSER